MIIKRTPLHDLQPRRICLIKPSALGDIVQSLPVLTALRTKWPNAHITWVVKQSLENVLDRNPELDEVMAYDDTGWPRWSALGGLCRRLRAANFDLAIDLQGLARSGLMTLATGAARRVGFSNARECSGIAYTDKVAVATLEMPSVDRYWLVARSIGATSEPAAPRIRIIPYLRKWAQKQIQGLPRPILAIHPGTRWETKRIPPRHYARIAERAWRELGTGIVLFGAGDEKELCEEIESQLSGPRLNLAGQTSIQQMAAICAEVTSFLSADTGPMHVAASVGTSVVSMFTCTSPLRAQAFGPAHTVVQTNVKCAASYLRTCPLLTCMHELTPARVWPAVALQLEEVSRKRVAA